MRRSLSKLMLHSNFHNKQVFSLLSLPFFTISINLYSRKQLNDLYSLKFNGIAKSVILKASNLGCNNCGSFSINVSFQDYLLRLSSICPESVQRFWRVSVLTPNDFLDILLGFECFCGKDELEVKKVESLWGIYTLADQQCGDFHHLPEACKIMARLLVNVGMFREVERLVSGLDGRGILLGWGEILSDLIEGYVGRFQLKRAISCHDRMRRLGLGPSLSCYRALLGYLVRLGETQLSYDLYLNMIDTGLEGTKRDIDIFAKVVRLLCKDGRVQEARNLVKSVDAFAISTNSLVLKALVDGYCKKKDYEDILSLFVELKCAPETQLGNKIIYSLCRNFGIERAESLMYQLRQLGFITDEKTYGTLIGWSCRERKLKKAMLYFSEILSRGFKPDIHSYNAIICGLLKEGLWEHAEHILCEMKDGGVIPDSSTFKVLLAGYFKARQFERVKNVVGEMADHGLIQLSLTEDPLAKALVILGLAPDFMKIKRDNDKKFFKTDFFDNLGNGLYLDTDLDEYEKSMTKVLNDSMFPDVNSLVLNSVSAGEMKHAVMMLYEMALWGQGPSSSCCSTLLLRLCASSPCSMKTLSGLLEKMFELTYNLEEETLNKLLQTFCRKGFTSKARIIFEGMLMRRLNIQNETYTSLLKGFCKKKDLICFRDCWNVARKNDWTPKLEDARAIFSCLCQLNLLNEAIQLFESMLSVYPQNLSNVLNALLENLCGGGSTFMAHILVEELLQQGFCLDSMAYIYLANGFCLATLRKLLCLKMSA
ncbi:hypothetical protein Leryth_013613 [Lithospermum erythrorhizon]|nr:hypothetical protein Leryth_013613 [Lithospermum erythrorhizon]